MGNFWKFSLFSWLFTSHSLFFVVLREKNWSFLKDFDQLVRSRSSHTPVHLPDVEERLIRGLEFLQSLSFPRSL